MRTPPIAGNCFFALVSCFAGCGGLELDEPASLRFTQTSVDGLTTDHASSGGASWVDYDGDGDLDLFVTNGYDVSADTPEGQSNRLYRNDGVQGFASVTAGPFATRAGISSGHTWGDYDNDGDLDVFVTNQQDQNDFLFRNDGEGRFAVIEDEPPVSDGGHSYTAAWVDVDNDGWLDLFVANGGMSHVGANALYRGLGDGHFEKISEGEIVTDLAATCGIAWGDYDGDGDLDLFVANQGFAPPGNHNALYRNDGAWTFTKITDSPVVEDGFPSCAATWVDIDNDLDFDLHVTNMYGLADLLYENDGRGGLSILEGSPLTVDGGHTYGANWEDFDNDGDIDALVANWGAAPVLYRNDGHGNFERADAGDLGARVEYVGAIASGDYDGDGRIDVYVGNWPNFPGPGELNSLYRNTGEQGHWLRIRLAGATSNRSGVGARVTVTTAAGSQSRAVTTQAGFRGQSDLAVHFGLGDVDRAGIVEVQWPAGGVSTLEDVEVDRVLTVTEGERI